MWEWCRNLQIRKTQTFIAVICSKRKETSTNNTFLLYRLKRKTVLSAVCMWPWMLAHEIIKNNMREVISTFTRS